VNEDYAPNSCPHSQRHWNIVMAEAFLRDAVRTPIGRSGGRLVQARTDDLAATADVPAGAQRRTLLPAHHVHRRRPAHLPDHRKYVTGKREGKSMAGEPGGTAAAISMAIQSIAGTATAPTGWLHQHTTESASVLIACTYAVARSLPIQVRKGKLHENRPCYWCLGLSWSGTDRSASAAWRQSHRAGSWCRQESAATARGPLECDSPCRRPDGVAFACQCLQGPRP